MEDTTRKVLNVSGIESTNGKITLLEQEAGKQYPTKYSFFLNSQSGEPTKAFTQFTELGVSIGKVYEVAVKETQGTNKMSGKPVTYRNVAYFYTDGVKGSPSSISSPKAYATAQKSVANTVSENINRFEAGKESNMRRMASGRDATLIVVAEMAQGQAWSEEDIKNRIKMYAKWFEESIYGAAFIS